MEHSTVRAYELVLKPGAPGGTGYGTEVSWDFLALFPSCELQNYRTY